MTDPTLRDAVINQSCSFHDPAACQDVPCGWCDNAAARADAIQALFVEWLCERGHKGVASDLADDWSGLYPTVGEP